MSPKLGEGDVDLSLEGHRPGGVVVELPGLGVTGEGLGIPTGESLGVPLSDIGLAQGLGSYPPAVNIGEGERSMPFDNDGLEPLGMRITAGNLQAQKLQQLHTQKQAAVAKDDYDEARRLKLEIDGLQATLLRQDPLGNTATGADFTGPDFNPSHRSPMGVTSPSSTRFMRLGSEAVLGCRSTIVDGPTSRTGLFMTKPVNEGPAASSLSPSLSVGFRSEPLSPGQKKEARPNPEATNSDEPRTFGATMREHMPATVRADGALIFKDSTKYQGHRQLPQAGALKNMRSAPNLTLTATAADMTYRRDGPDSPGWSPTGLNKRPRKNRSEAANAAIAAMKEKEAEVAIAMMKEREADMAISSMKEKAANAAVAAILKGSPS